MDQKTFTIIFIVLLIIAVGGIAYSKFSESISQSLSPLGEASTAPLAQTSSSSANLQLPDATSGQQQRKTYPKFPGVYPADQLKNKGAVISTNKGDIAFEIYPEATKAASNFIFLANDKFFDGLIFHRVEGWVVQGGDPTGTGRGGPGYNFEDEPVTKKYERGIVAMANAGPNTNGSQFFILTKDTPLQPNYTIFGKVLKGMDVVDKIKVGDKMEKVVIVNLK